MRADEVVQASGLSLKSEGLLMTVLTIAIVTAVAVSRKPQERSPWSPFVRFRFGSVAHVDYLSCEFKFFPAIGALRESIFTFSSSTLTTFPVDSRPAGSSS